MQATRMRYGGSYFYGDHSFFETSICPGFSEGQTKSYLALSRGTGGLMRCVLLNAALLACVTPAIAQNSSSNQTAANPATTKTNRRVVGSPTQTVKEAPTAVELPAETPVVTIKGVCDPGKKSESQDCKTVITRGQMDQIAQRIAPGTPPASHQQMGEAAANATDNQLRQYYAEHPSEFEEVEVLQLSLPTSGNSRKGMRLDRAMLKTEADGLHSRAVSGYDFDQLQVQAYADLGITQPPPPTRLTIARRNSMPEDQAQVFDLQPGEITPVIESYTKLVFLTLVAKHTVTFESVLPDIKAAVKQKRLEQEIEKASKSVTADFNLEYLGMHAQPALFTLHGDMKSLANAATPDQRSRVSRRPMATNTAPATVPPKTQAHP